MAMKEWSYKERGHQLSPSSWNNFSSCPRKFWLSRQRLPRKAGMASAIGTAVHNSVEDLCNLDLDGRDGDEKGWLPPTANAILEQQWQAEKKTFLSTPRHPRWKQEEYPRARKLLIGSLNILFAKARTGQIALSEVSVAMWRDIQKMVLAAEGTLRTTCGRLMGRLDLLVSDIDEDGNIVGWIVADLKTGKPPSGELYDTVSRQLRFYRDILCENNPDHPPVKAEGWYSNGSVVFQAEGPSVLPEAFEAWEASKITDTPMEAKPGSEACGFCEWKAWCPAWVWAQAQGELKPSGIFRDMIAVLEKVEIENGICLVERMAPLDEDGNLARTGQRAGAVFAGQALERLKSLIEEGHEGPVFLGGVRLDGETWKLGDWCDVLPWSPLLQGIKRD
ncbi:MAG: PD-(D/E)XK nuclease family protein [Candidatus Thalassarchaeaceae archaeon]|nr:PD-(D/E)XK nuclease family protein [Candidatus Thalassarchaeaceae archaeon]